MDEYYYLEEYFKEKTGFFHEDWIYSMTYDKKIDYLEYLSTSHKVTQLVNHRTYQYSPYQ